MDSFYGPSNRRPLPRPSEKILLEPTVPDASLICNIQQGSFINRNQDPATYNGWKNQMKMSNSFPVNSHDNQKQTSMIRKQVRFESPIYHKNSSPINEVVTSSTKAFGANTDGLNSFIEDSKTNCEGSFIPSMGKVFQSKPFEEIYMANIPNRHLDLSLIDIVGVQPMSEKRIGPNCNIQSSSNKENELNCNPLSNNGLRQPTTYKEFLDAQKSRKLYEEFLMEEVEIKTPLTYRDFKKKYNVQNKKRSFDYVTDIYNYQRSCDDNNGAKNTLPSNTVEQTDNEKSKIEHLRTFPSSDNYMNNPKNVTEKTRQDVQNIYDSYQSHNNYNDYRNGVQHPKEHVQEKNDNQDLANTNNSKDISIMTDPVSAVATKITEEPTMKDLLKIIHQQNEQLLILQKQVSSLIVQKDYPKQIEMPPQVPGTNIDRPILSEQNKHLMQNLGSTPRKGPLPKFSIDLMTSFEVSFRPQQNVFQKKSNRDLFHEPKIREIIETSIEPTCDNTTNNKGIVDTSLQLQEPISVKENCPSPEPSIRIDMNDYDSSDDDDSISDIGSTFYKNVMEQVNNFIQRGQMPSRNENVDPTMTDRMKEKTMNKVRDITFRHLKKIGVNLSPIHDAPELNNSSGSSDMESKEISFVVKQLLMKYLPNEQFGKFINQNEAHQVNKPRKEEKIILNSRAPQFSFASVQFMKKYNLIQDSADGTGRTTNIRPPVQNIRSKDVRSNPKILDISTLKLQPKLL